MEKQQSNDIFKVKPEQFSDFSKEQLSKIQVREWDEE